MFTLLSFWVVKTVDLSHYGFRWSLATPGPWTLDPEPPFSPVQQKKTKRELTGKERQQIGSRLLFEMQHSGTDGKFLRGTLTVIAGKFNVTRRTISRIWARAQEQFQNPDIRQFHASPQKRRSVDNTGNETMIKFVKLLHLSPF